MLIFVVVLFKPPTTVSLGNTRFTRPVFHESTHKKKRKKKSNPHHKI